jgi:uncharacterized protein (TIGR02118 family)
MVSRDPSGSRRADTWQASAGGTACPTRARTDSRILRAGVIKIVGYWTAPPDPADIPRFEDDYLGNHVPLAATLPGLRRLTTLRVERGHQGEAIHHYRIVEAWFDDRDALDAALASPEFATVRRDRQRLIDTYGVMNTAEIGEEVEARLPGS